MSPWEREILEENLQVTYDLSGALTDRFGAQITFTRVRGIRFVTWARAPRRFYRKRLTRSMRGK